MKIISVSIAVIFLLNACAPPESGYICREHGMIRPCNQKEMRVIAITNKIIDGIRNYRPGPEAGLDRDRIGDDAHVKFYGEFHLDVIGQMKNIGLMNHDYRPGDVLLLEGADKRYYRPDCLMYLIKGIFYANEFSKLNMEYTPDFRAYLNNKENYNLIFNTVRDSFDLRDLKLNNIRCGYWDKEIPDFLLMTEYKKIKVRNKSMVDAINFWRPHGRRILVVSGLAHLVSGDRILTATANRSRRVAIPDHMPAYFELIKSQRKLPSQMRSLVVLESARSTKPIYEYLTKWNISYKEYFHGELIL